jgi:hypothetical protein
LLGLLAGAVAARGEVRLDVFLGYDDIVPEASWFPVVCEVYNDGPSFNAVFEFGGARSDQGQMRRMAIELPTGTLKRFVIPVFATSRYAEMWEARLLDTRGRVHAERLGLRPRRQVSWESPLMAALSRAPGRLTMPPVHEKVRDRQPEIARLQANIFPDNAISLEGLDVLYLHAEKAVELNVGQVNALLSWLYGGGHLIVGVEQLVHLHGNEWLRRLLPYEFTDLVTVKEHPEIHAWLTSNARHDGGEYRFSDSPAAESETPAVEAPPVAGSRPGAPRRLRPVQVVPPRTLADLRNPFADLAPDPKFEETPLQVAVGRRRDGAVLFGPPERPLAVMARRGRGQLTVLTFSPDLEPFLSWKQRGHFWYKLAGMPPEWLATQVPSRYAAYAIDGVMGAIVDSRQVHKLPVGWLLLLLVGYLLVIGPFDRYWLRKINRPMWTWVTFPLYVVAFSGLIYVIGYKLRAGETEWNELHVVDVIPLGEQAELRGRTFASIYSPVNARYKLASDAPFATFRGEYLRHYYRGGRETSKALVEQRGNSFVAEAVVPVWTSQLFVNDWLRRGEPLLRFTVSGAADSRQVVVDSRLDQDLKDVRLVLGDQVYTLGEVPAWKTLTLELAGRPSTNLTNLVVPQAGRFASLVQKRQQAFGTEARVSDIPATVMAAGFASLSESQDQFGNRNQFITPPGFDLTALAQQGQAVLLAWAPGYSPVNSITRFTPRRRHQDTLLRVTARVP